MGHFFAYVYWGSVFVGTALFLVAPFMLWNWSPGSSMLRKLTSTLAVYFAVAVGLGMFGYAVLPAQYTRNQNWSWPPTSNSLLEIHSDFLARLKNPEAIRPENDAPIREMIHEERVEYFQRWSIVSLTGGVLLLAFAWPAMWLAHRGAPEAP